MELSKPVKMAYLLNDQCLNPQPIEKTNVSLAARIFSESTRNALRYYIENYDDYKKWKGTLMFLDIVAKWWDMLNVKTPSKAKQKRNPDFEKITVDNIQNITEYFAKIVEWTDQWKKSGLSGLSDPTFKTFRQVSSTVPLLLKYLLENHDIKYILTGKLQSDFLEKRFGRYRQLSGANYFVTEKQFLEAEKSIRIKSLIKFSRYSIKDVQVIMKKDKVIDENIIKSHVDYIIDCISEAGKIDVPISDSNIIYYVAGFIAKVLKQKFKCQGCIDFLTSVDGEDEMPDLIIKDIPEECKNFIDMINRGGLVKPSMVVNLLCIGAWELYQVLMNNDDSKSYFLKCKVHRPVFTGCFNWFVRNSDDYLFLLGMKCSNDHSFELMIKKIAEKFFNVMATNFVKDINSDIHSKKKRSTSNKLTPSSAKIRKLQSST